MQKSTEIRWFIREQQQAKDIEEWFMGNEYRLKFSDENEFPRQDYYLILPGIVSLGVKIREPKKRKEDYKLLSKVEIKLLGKELGTIDLKRNNKGAVNSWIKFGFDLVPDERMMLTIIKSFLPKVGGEEFDFVEFKKHWVKIDKDRLLLKYDIGREILVEEGRIISEGSGIEFTRIRLAEQIYYSLGIESFSETNKQDENFYKTISYLFAHLKASGLCLVDSISYPQFLNSFSTRPFL